MEDINTTSAEMQEVAEPAETDASESVETQEVAEPEVEVEATEETSTRNTTEADAAFAEQRRRIKELEDSNKQMYDALQRFFDGESAEELSINANAYAEQRDPEEYRQEYEHNKEFEKLQADKEELEQQLMNIQVNQLMDSALRELQEIDPEVKSIDDMGESFLNFVGAGLSTKEAYYATKTMEAKEKVTAPDPVGRVSDTVTERDYYTSEELDRLTSEEMDDPEVWAKVQRSMNRL